MASGTIYLTESAHTSGGSWIEGKVTWSSVKYTSSNTSKVTAKIYVRKRPDSLTIATSGSWQYKLNIIVDGVGRDTKTHSISKSVLTDWVLLAETAETITHNNDGKKTFKIEGSVSAPSGTGYAGLTTKKTSSDLSLDNIARASTISLSRKTITLSMTAGTEMFSTITINPASSSFKHTLSYSVGTSGTKSLDISSDNTAAIIGYTSTFAPYIPNGTQAKCTITCTTYNGSISSANKIGTSTAELTIKIPESVAPSINNANIVISEGEYQFIDTNKSISESYCISGFSKCTISASFVAGYGSSISSCSITGPGILPNNNATITYTSDKHAQGTAEIQTLTLTDSGTLTYTIKVTDTRNRTSTQKVYIYCYPYNSPSVKVSAERGNVPTQVKLNYSLSRTTINNEANVDRNSFTTLVIDYKSSSEVWGEHRSIIQNVSGQGMLLLTGGNGGFDVASTYEFRAYVLDSVLQYFDENYPPIASNIASVGTIYRLFNADLDKNAIAFGHMASKENTFECDLNATFNGSMAIGNSLIMDGEDAIYKDPYTNQTIIYGNSVVLGATGSSNISIAGNAVTTGELIVQNHSTPIGSVVQAASTTVEVSSGTYTHITSITLPAGAWIITGSLYRPGIDTASVPTGGGVFRATLSTTQTDGTYHIPNSGNGTLYGTTDTSLYGGSYANAIEVVLLNVITSQTTFYLTGYQSSGSKLSLQGAIRAMRIA